MNRKHCLAEFRDLLDGFDNETLEADNLSIFGLTNSLKIAYFNEGWLKFAAENDGEPTISEKFGLGAFLYIGINSHEVRQYYIDLYQQILSTRKVAGYDYECSSSKQFRLFHQTIYPLEDSRGLLVVNTLVKKGLKKSVIKITKPDKKLYTDDSGFICQCSCCRRTLRNRTGTWEWIPQFIEHMPDNVSHSFCQICYDHYFKRLPVAYDANIKSS